MASESTDERVSVSLPAELAEWVDRQAAERETDRETVLVQLLSAYRATEQLENGDGADVESLAGAADIDGVVRNVLADQLAEIAEAVADQLDIEPQVAEIAEEQLADLPEAAVEQAVAEATDRVDERTEAITDDYMEKIQEVRNRVIQVKRETDGKAPADHDHQELADRLDALESETADIREAVEDLPEGRGDREDLAEGVADAEDRLDDIDEAVDDVQEKLRTVAHVVREMRDTGVGNKHAASVDRIKQSAAELDIERARCEVCGEGARIALMTGPECPHCQAVVTDVTGGEGFFGRPKLVKAQGITAPDEQGGADE